MKFDYSYEQGIERLELINEKLSSGLATLDDSIKLFKEASELIKYCEDLLKKAELVVEKMTTGFEGA